MLLIDNLKRGDFPNPDDLKFSVSNFYNRVFTVSDATSRPRNVYHGWKAEKLIPPHFGKDYWWQFQDVFDIPELDWTGWDKLNFVELSWIKLVDILRRHGYPKASLKRDAEVYFKISDALKEQFKKVLIQHKPKMRDRFDGLSKEFGIEYVRSDFNRTFREVTAEMTFNTFDSLILSAIYQREPLSFLASHQGRMVPFVAGEPVGKDKAGFIDSMLSGPHIIIPFYKELDRMLYSEAFNDFAQNITSLNKTESFLIASIRDKKVKEINIKKNNKQDELTIRQKENGYVGVDDERTLMRLMRNKEYKRIDFISVDGKKKFFEGESVHKLKVA